jgi:hypothetical protein
MLEEPQIRKLLDDIRTAYEVGYQKDDLTSEAEKWGQIQVLEWILTSKSTNKILIKNGK